MAGVQRFLPCKREPQQMGKTRGRWEVVGYGKYFGRKYRMKYGEDRNDTQKSKKRNLHNIAYHR